MAPAGYVSPEYNLPCFGRGRHSGRFSGSVLKCEACGQPVDGASRQTLGKTWHPQPGLGWHGL